MYVLSVEEAVSQLTRVRHCHPPTLCEIWLKTLLTDIPWLAFKEMHAMLETWTYETLCNGVVMTVIWIIWD